MSGENFEVPPIEDLLQQGHDLHFLRYWSVFLWGGCAAIMVHIGASHVVPRLCMMRWKRNWQESRPLQSRNSTVTANGPLTQRSSRISTDFRTQSLAPTQQINLTTYSKFKRVIFWYLVLGGIISAVFGFAMASAVETMDIGVLVGETPSPFARIIMFLANSNIEVNQSLIMIAQLSRLWAVVHAPRLRSKSTKSRLNYIIHKIKIFLIPFGMFFAVLIVLLSAGASLLYLFSPSPLEEGMFLFLVANSITRVVRILCVIVIDSIFIRIVLHYRREHSPEGRKRVKNIVVMLLMDMVLPAICIIVFTIFMLPNAIAGLRLGLITRSMQDVLHTWVVIRLNREVTMILRGPLVVEISNDSQPSKSVSLSTRWKLIHWKRQSMAGEEWQTVDWKNGEMGKSPVLDRGPSLRRSTTLEMVNRPDDENDEIVH